MEELKLSHAMYMELLESECEIYDAFEAVSLGVLGGEGPFEVENITISTGDYIFPRSLQQGQFRSAWETLAAQGTELTQKLSLNFKTLEAGVDWIVGTLNMQPCDNTGKVEPGGRGHTALLSGTFLGGQTCLVKALVGMDAERGCVARVTARAKGAEVCQAAQAICGLWRRFFDGTAWISGPK